jgi:hypothetical protein
MVGSSAAQTTSVSKYTTSSAILPSRSRKRSTPDHRKDRSPTVAVLVHWRNTRFPREAHSSAWNVKSGKAPLIRSLHRGTSDPLSGHANVGCTKTPSSSHNSVKPLESGRAQASTNRETKSSALEVDTDHNPPTKRLGTVCQSNSAGPGRDQDGVNPGVTFELEGPGFGRGVVAKDSGSPPGHCATDLPTSCSILIQTSNSPVGPLYRGKVTPADPTQSGSRTRPASPLHDTCMTAVIPLACRIVRERSPREHRADLVDAARRAIRNRGTVTLARDFK